MLVAHTTALRLILLLRLSESAAVAQGTALNFTIRMHDFVHLTITYEHDILMIAAINASEDFNPRATNKVQGITLSAPNAI